MAEITVAVTAHDEEATIAATLRSLQGSIAHAERHGSDTFDLVAVLDRCTDRTAEIVDALGVRSVHVVGGLVEAQRVVAGLEPFVVFCDADVTVDDSTILELTVAMNADESLAVAFAASVPNRPARSTLLARALHTYNPNDGFEVERHFFSGRCFAIRGWDIPHVGDLADRLARVRTHRFYRFHEGVVADDIYLSKSIAHRHGVAAMQRVPSAVVRFQPPETLDGMYRYLRRMRTEIHRVDTLFPEFRRADVPTVGRRVDRRRLAAATRSQQFHWVVFRVAARWCVLRYVVERAYYTHLSTEPCPLWPPVIESKRTASDVSDPLDRRPSRSGTS